MISGTSSNLQSCSLLFSWILLNQAFLLYIKHSALWKFLVRILTLIDLLSGRVDLLNYLSSPCKDVGWRQMHGALAGHRALCITTASFFFEGHLNSSFDSCNTYLIVCFIVGKTLGWHNWGGTVLSLLWVLFFVNDSFRYRRGIVSFTCFHY